MSPSLRVIASTKNQLVCDVRNWSVRGTSSDRDRRRAPLSSAMDEIVQQVSLPLALRGTWTALSPTAIQFSTVTWEERSWDRTYNAVRRRSILHRKWNYPPWVERNSISGVKAYFGVGIIGSTCFPCCLGAFNFDFRNVGWRVKKYLNVANFPVHENRTKGVRE